MNSLIGEYQMELGERYMTLDDKIEEVRVYVDEHFSDADLKWQVGISGGKDSTATYLLMLELGIDFVPCFADTGNENPLTEAHAMSLAERTGGPEVIKVGNYYSDEDFAKRRKHIADKWSQPHRIRSGSKRGEYMPPFPNDVIEEAISILKPTGNNFLDLCLLHGMFPMRTSQFCTRELKLTPIREQIVQPWLDSGYDVVLVSGVRADESAKRASYPRHSMDTHYQSVPDDVFQFRPILDWKAEDCFAMHKRHGIEPNPLYRAGMSRVGCMPCIHATQSELVDIHKRFPAEIERITRWESLVAKVSRWCAFHEAHSSMFVGPRAFGGKERLLFKHTEEYIRWVGDKPGHDLDEPAPACSSVYGLCE